MAKRVETCPQCGAEFSRRRLACPECGSDARTGWRSAEDIDYEAVELPDRDEERAASVTRTRRVGAFVLLFALVALLVLLFALGWP